MNFLQKIIEFLINFWLLFHKPSTFLEKSIIVFEGFHEALKYSMPDSKTILIIDGNGTKSAQKEASKG